MWQLHKSFIYSRNKIIEWWFIYLFLIFLSIANIFVLKFSLTLIHLSLIMLLRGREVSSGSGAVLVLNHREGEKKRWRDGGWLRDCWWLRIFSRTTSYHLRFFIKILENLENLKQREKAFFFKKQTYLMAVSTDEAEKCPHFSMLELFSPIIS